MSLVFHDLEERRAEVERHRENSARLAYTYATLESEGQGSLEFGERINFGLTFTERPYLTLGWEVDLDELEEAVGEGRSIPPLPLVTGYISAWDQDDRGFWTGAWYAARVWFPPTDLIPITAKPIIQHHLSFAGVAMKDVPTNLDD